MGRKPIATSITFDGPFFKHDPVKTFRENVKTMMLAVALEGKADVETQMRAGEHGRKPIRRLGDRAADHVVGRTRSLSGKRWAVTGVVSINNSVFSGLEGMSLMAAASAVEGQTKAFKRTAARIRKSRAANLDELLKGVE